MVYNDRALAPPLPYERKPLITRLPRNGPKPGQSMEAWLHGKDSHCQAERDAVQWKKP